jgi:hypothetical protein
LPSKTLARVGGNRDADDLSLPNAGDVFLEDLGIHTKNAGIDQNKDLRRLIDHGSEDGVADRHTARQRRVKRDRRADRVGFRDDSDLFLRKAQDMQLLFGGIELGPGAFQFRLGDHQILLGPDTPVEESLFPLMAALSEFEIGRGLVKRRLRRSDFFALEGDQGASGPDPIADPDMDVRDPGREGIADNRLAHGMSQDFAHGFQCVPHGPEDGRSGRQFQEFLFLFRQDDAIGKRPGRAEPPVRSPAPLPSTGWETFRASGRLRIHLRQIRNLRAGFG